MRDEEGWGGPRQSSRVGGRAAVRESTRWLGRWRGECRYGALEVGMSPARDEDGAGELMESGARDGRAEECATEGRI